MTRQHVIIICQHLVTDNQLLAQQHTQQQEGDWNAKVGKDACGNWQGICGPFCNNDTNERGLRLLEFWSLPPLTIFCWRTLLVITKHPEDDGPDIAQTNNTTARLITF